MHPKPRTRRHRVVICAASGEKKPPEILDNHLQRLRSIADRIRRANAAGHRLAFTGETVLDSIQQANSDCANFIRTAATEGGERAATLEDCAAVLAQIIDTIQALRERVTFRPL